MVQDRMNEAVLTLVEDGLLLDDGMEKVSLPDTVEALDTAIRGYRKRLISVALTSAVGDPGGYTQLSLARYKAAIRVLEMRLDDLGGSDA